MVQAGGGEGGDVGGTVGGVPQDNETTLLYGEVGLQLPFEPSTRTWA